MIDQIFELIMKEARSREGKDLLSNIGTVLLEVDKKVMDAMERLPEEERRRKRHEKQT